MTIRKHMEKILCEHGMWPEDAVATVRLAESSPECSAMALRWDDEADWYPKPVLVLTWMVVKGVAIQWIDEHAPKAWYRPMFEE